MDPPTDHDNEFRNWLELPEDITSSILLRLGAFEILTSAQKVCSQWHNLCRDPSMWRAIDMGGPGNFLDMYDLESMCRQAVDRSCGQLVDISIEKFGTDDLLKYIVDSSSQIKRLRLVNCHDISDEGFTEAAAKLPLLEELDISYNSLSREPLEAFGRCCPLLKSLKFKSPRLRVNIECDDVALAIGDNMPELRYLQLCGNKLTKEGLQAILDGCPHLELLDLRLCVDLTLSGSLGQRCGEQIKDLRRPHDPIDGYGFEFGGYYGSFDEDYPSGLSDIDHFSDNYGYYEFSDYDDFHYDDFTAIYSDDAF